MSSPGPLDTHTLALGVLDAIADALDSLPIFDATLDGAPDRQFVSPGVSVDDFVGRDCCAQVSVWVSPITEADTTPGGQDAGRRSSRFAWINQVAINGRVTRCIPTEDPNASGFYTPPTADVLTEASRQHDADGWALWNHLHNAVHAADLLSLCDEMFFDGVVPLIPSGGCAGWQISLRASLGGYEEELGS
jgi:hypothetical protein